MNDFAENLCSARLIKKFSKAEMAKALGVSLTAYSLYEKAEREPPLRRLKKISELLEVSIDELLMSKTEVKPTKELHIYLDWNYPAKTHTNFKSTDMAVSLNFPGAIIHTTQTHFCSWKYVNMGYRLFVHKDGRMIELKVGKNPSTDRLLKGTESLECLLLGGEFDFTKGDLN